MAIIGWVDASCTNEAYFYLVSPPKQVVGSTHLLTLLVAVGDETQA